MSAPHHLVDVVVVVVVVGLAVAFLITRFVGPGRASSPSGAVVVGASLHKGLDKARRRRARSG
jgi:hypothetical protein